MPNAHLKLQESTIPDQVLVLAQIASYQSPQRTFTADDVWKLFDEFRLPIPGKLSPTLASHARNGRLRKMPSGAWSLTPLGAQSVNSLGVAWRDVIGQQDALTVPSPELAGAQHHTIPPQLAPQKLQHPVTRFLDANRFETNVFGISRFPRAIKGGDPITTALETSRTTLDRFGLKFHLASDKSVEDEVWGNVAASMWACALGVAIIEDTAAEGVNKNVLIEVGAMLMTGRRCVLLLDKTVPTMPTDLVGHIYRRVDLTDASTISRELTAWCEKDLSLTERA